MPKKTYKDIKGTKQVNNLKKEVKTKVNNDVEIIKNAQWTISEGIIKELDEILVSMENSALDVVEDKLTEAYNSLINEIKERKDADKSCLPCFRKPETESDKAFNKYVEGINNERFDIKADTGLMSGFGIDYKMDVE